MMQNRNICKLMAAGMTFEEAREALDDLQSHHTNPGPKGTRAREILSPPVDATILFLSGVVDPSAVTVKDLEGGIVVQAPKA